MKLALPWQMDDGELLDKCGIEIVESLFPATYEEQQYILRAVNSHDELVEALESIVRVVSDSAIMRDAAREEIHEARAILAKAKGYK